MTTAERPHTVIGTRPIRPDGVDKVTGHAVYGADVRLNGMLTGRVLRSPHAHAVIKRIDASKALALPGVYAVVTFEDFPEPADPVMQTIRGPMPSVWDVERVMARRKVLFKGHPVAAIAANDQHLAEDALDLIEVEYEVLPSTGSNRPSTSSARPSSWRIGAVGAIASSMLTTAGSTSYSTSIRSRASSARC